MAPEPGSVEGNPGHGFSAWAHARRDRFGTLLVLLVAAFLVTGLDNGSGIRVLGTLLNMAALVVGVVATGLDEARPKVALVILVGLFGTGLVAAFPLTDLAGALGALSQAFLLFVLLVAVVRRILNHDSVSLATILGSIAAYFLIGLVFAWIYLALAGLVDGPILDPPDTAVPAYYSFVVLSTLGFGDITPVDEFARRITTIEAMSGQIFLATLVARLVAMYRGPGNGPGGPAGSKWFCLLCHCPGAATLARPVKASVCLGA